MWSGPRNISTAMMRSWENRPDTAVVDEPLYAAYLAATNVDHPGREEIVGAGETDWQRVVQALVRTPIPQGASIYYQKHMTHHLLPDMEWDWILELSNCFLIRDPEEVIASYLRKRANPTLQDLGVLQQWELFEFVKSRQGRVPPVIDARQVLETPGEALRGLCRALEVEFDERMLQWPRGLRDSDGVWAKYWYDSVKASTGFRPYRRTDIDLPRQYRRLAEQSRDVYRQLLEFCNAIQQENGRSHLPD